MIKVLASKSANYIFHMLSAGNCGYDNTYGANAKQYHDDNDLKYLETVKKFITVNGGEYCGELYGICIGNPASFDDENDMLEYFDALIDLFENGVSLEHYNRYFEIYLKSFGSNGIDICYESLNEFYNSCIQLKEIIMNILRIFRSNYIIYCKKFWDKTYDEIVCVSSKLDCIFVNEEYQEKWERLLNVEYKYHDFHVVLCNSIEKGPQAIDITYNKDIFALPSNNFENFCKFVSHEFGIYLLRDIFHDSNAFKDISTYEYRESLAEYYNRIICGGCNDFNWNDKIIDQYEKEYKDNANLSPLELFAKVLAK